jgi:hypothetical protein
VVVLAEAEATWRQRHMRSRELQEPVAVAVADLPTDRLDQSPWAASPAMSVMVASEVLALLRSAIFQ